MIDLIRVLTGTGRGRLFLLSLAVVAVAAVCALPAPAHARAPVRVTFWVSPRGDDRADGSRLQPFRSLARARDAGRAARRADPGAQVSILLQSGTYRLGGPLILDWRDSGAPGRDVVWAAAPGARPVISGAIRVRGWRLLDRARHIWVANVGRGLATRQLYVNGRRAVRARSSLFPRLARTASGFRAPDAAMASWPDAGGIEAVTLSQWKTMRCPVAAIDGRQIVMRQPCWRNANVFPYQWSFQTADWLENAYEFLDAPGEWYLDPRLGRLFYIPRAGERLARADVELPVAPALLQVRGTLARPVAHMRFHGLTFAYATWLAPAGANGYVADQSGFHLVGYGHRPNAIGHDPDTVRTPGDVSLSYARAVDFDHNDFLHLGAAGLDFSTGSQQNAIVGNRFDDISAAAIQLGGVAAIDHHPRHPGELTRDNVIANNLITDIGREYFDAAGIYVGFTTRSRIEHNDISNVPWSGIAIGWGWGLLDPGSFPGVPGAASGQWGRYSTPTASRANRILDNRISRFLQQLWDGGAIYTQGRQGVSAADGELIAGNVAMDKRPHAGGNTFYTDGGSRYVTLEHNVSLDNPPGVTDFGPCGLPDSLVLCGAVVSYGSDRGGCRPYGDLLYRENYLEHPDVFFSICPHPPYPVGVRDVATHVISGAQQVPASILDAAGRQPAYRAHVGAGG